ncbi:MAG: prephenate dehydrogenase/arogenate dehydrogenase family protein [Clostridia bacterium]|nr:prephenate dehydrogenase/arogenate dehydrogenase family protein [Clostridia bacterium]
MEKILIVGIGLIGGSIARDLGAVYALDKDEESLKRAQGCLIKGFGDISKVDIIPDIVLLCVPVNVAISMAEELTGRFPDALYIDCCSTKRTVEAAYSSVSYAGMHPMAGSEGSGFEHSRKGLCKGAVMCVSGSGGARERAIKLAVALGGRVVELDAASHDRAVATVSHLPHIIASSLCASADAQRAQMPVIKELAAGGFADITRIADSDPTMWSAIYRDNADMLLESLDSFERELDKWRVLIKKGDITSLKEHFEACKRSKQPFKREGKGIYPKEGVRLFVQCDEQDAPELCMIAMRNKAVAVSRCTDGVSIVCTCRDDALGLKALLTSEEKWKNTVL